MSSPLALPRLSAKKVERLVPSTFVKWAGGKTQLLTQYSPYFPNKLGTYYEPFLGSGAVFFYLYNKDLIKNAVLSDFNEELMNCYHVIKEDVEGLIKELESGDYRNEKEAFYKIRELDKNPEFKRLSRVKMAARTIYLNRTCYNGLYRVNSKGQFNVPFGRYSNPQILDKTNLRAASEVLKKVKLMSGDFEKALRGVKKGDFVYLDPPYDPLSKTSSFTSYTSNGFGKAEQERLARVFQKLHHKGTLLMLSNSNTKLIESLYNDFSLHRIKARRLINSKVEGRGELTELLITNY